MSAPNAVPSRELVALRLLYQACRATAVAWGHPPTWLAAFDEPPKSPLAGYCFAVALTVRAVLGGDVVRGRVQGVGHYWNRLPDGREVDLTSCQFGGDGRTPLRKGRRMRAPNPVPLQFLVFAKHVADIMQTSPIAMDTTERP